MKGKIICIVIALMILSISAIIGANPNILGRFSSTWEGHPVEVTISGNLPWFVPTSTLKGLRAAWREHEGRIVTFAGSLEEVYPLGSDVVSVMPKKLILRGYPFVEVYPLDAPNLPEGYEPWKTYTFTGFLMEYERHLPFEDRGARVLRVNAFQIWHLGETKSDSGESDLSPDEDANPKDGTDSQGETK